MKIAGNQEEILVSMQGLTTTLTYRLPKSSFYGVSLKNGKQTVYQVFFSDNKKAKNLTKTKKEQITLVKLPFVDDSTGGEIECAYFYFKSCANMYEERMRNNELDKVIEKAQPTSSTIKGLERLAGLEDDLGGFDEQDSESIAEFEKQFEEKSKISLDTAKKLLASLAKFYLDLKIIDNNEYLKQKVELEEVSLAGLIFQLDVSQTAIKKLLLAIHMDRASVKQYEALAKLQGIVLDINKCQSTLIKDMTADLKTIKDRYKEVEESIDSSSESMEGEVFLQTRDVSEGIKFIRQNIKEFDQRVNSAELEEED